jgi:CheY-like chemotaxis protein
MKVMLVDDDSDDRMLFTEAIKHIDETIEFELATDGKDAIKKLKGTETLPDAIFLDINMPVLDGRECFKQLKCDGKLKNVRVVMLSTSNDEAEIRSFENRGAAYLVKPSSFKSLVASLRTCLSSIHAAMM